MFRSCEIASRSSGPHGAAKPRQRPSRNVGGVCEVCGEPRAGPEGNLSGGAVNRWNSW